MKKIMNQSILLLSSIFAIIILFLKFKFGIMHKYTIINIVAVLAIIIIIIFNIMCIFKFKKICLKIIHIILSIILICLTSYLILINLLNLLFGPVKTINTYVYPNNNKETLSNIYFADNTHISTPIQLVYEKEFILGIKCRVSIKVNNDNTNLYNLEEEYNKLKNISDKGFCNYKLNINKINLD